MSGLVARAGIVDAIWLVGRDGRWRRGIDFANELHVNQEEVEAALGLLVTYGFAESSVFEERRFRMTAGGPSPVEAAGFLSSMKPGVF